MAGSLATRIASPTVTLSDGTESKLKKVIIEFTSDSANASIPSYAYAGSGFLCSAELAMDADVPPTSVILQITSQVLSPLPGFPAPIRTTSGFALSPGDYPPLDFSEGLLISGTVVGNSKKFRAILNILV